MKLLVSIIILCFCIHPAFSQENEPLPDSAKVHSVKKAVILSSCLPGAGQVYNHLSMPKGKKKAFWKVPLIYAGLGASGYFLVSNQIEVNRLKEEYNFRQDNAGSFKYSEYQDYDDYGVLALREGHLNYRDLSILAFGAVYVLQIVDAGVEAHFVNFDVSEDLSLRIQPELIFGLKPGIGLCLNFR